VENATASSRHLQALSALIDDTSPVVRRSLLTHFEQLGEPARALLRDVARGDNRVAATHAQWFLSELRWADPASEFVHFIRSLNYELESGAILIARVADPKASATSVGAMLDAIASRCRELMVEPLSPWQKCSVINRVLFHELGFRGNTGHYNDPLNSLIHRVLERRTGLPLTLSVVYLLVADRCGLTLEPVALPGHFVVGCFTEDEPVYIDPFRGGAVSSREDLMTWLAGNDLPRDDSSLAPATIRETLSRCCRNLAAHYTSAGDEALARQFAGFDAEFEATHRENMPP
jgi:regulator of sirC expression with transglutaminase-like and TPR domain